MTISSKEVLKRYFETGDRPTQSQFADMFDSLVIVPGASAAAVSLGLVEIESTAKSTARSISSIGVALIAASTTAAAVGTLGATGVGTAIFTAATTAAARTILGVVSGGTVGQALYEATTTAAAQQTLGGGTVGRLIYEVATTAAAQNIVGGVVKQIVAATPYTANADLTTTIPFDDTTPQNTEGTQILTLTLAALSNSANSVRLQFQGQVAGDATASQVMFAIFRTGTASAIAAGYINLTGSSGTANGGVKLDYVDAPGSVGPHTYTVRIGPQGGTIRMNGSNTARFLGGTSQATLIATEY